MSRRKRKGELEVWGREGNCRSRTKRRGRKTKGMSGLIASTVLTT